VAVAGSDATVVEKVKYDPYGQATVTVQQNQNASGNPYLFQGRRWDSEVSLYYFRKRVYSPVLGRFVQREAEGEHVQPNPYDFVFSGPLLLVDPYGTQAECNCRWVQRITVISGPCRPVGKAKWTRWRLTWQGDWSEGTLQSHYWVEIMEWAEHGLLGWELRCVWVRTKAYREARELVQNQERDAWMAVREVRLCDSTVTGVRNVSITSTTLPCAPVVLKTETRGQQLRQCRLKTKFFAIRDRREAADPEWACTKYFFWPPAASEYNAWDCRYVRE